MKACEIFKSCNKCNSNIFHSDQSINKPTLLINSEIQTHNKFLRLIKLKEILPVTDFVRLKLTFKNMHDSEIKEFKDVPFAIIYPDGSQFRPWKINIPNLIKKDDCCFAETDILFKPEVPGNHRLVIKHIDGLQFADLYGLTDRKFKIIDKDWTASFYIYSSLELRFYVIALLALIVSLFSLVIALIGGQNNG